MSVDLGHYNGNFYNYSLVAATAADKVGHVSPPSCLKEAQLITMGTYCSNLTLFTQRLEESVLDIGLTKLGVGLMLYAPTCFIDARCCFSVVNVIYGAEIFLHVCVCVCVCVCIC